MICDRLDIRPAHFRNSSLPFANVATPAES
jgi:hypothetical protein